MKIRYIVWLDYVKDKIQWKHDVHPSEVVEVFQSKPRFFRKETGRVEGEHVYNALGRTYEGRYLSVFFIHKKNNDVIILTARGMSKKERDRYGKK